MASIENKSRYIVSVKNSETHTRSFAENRKAPLKRYIAELRAQGLKPQLERANDNYVVRIREAGYPTQTLTAGSEQEAIDIKARIELERRNSLFIDYAKGRSVTFGDLITRYLREVAPRHKGFEVEAYLMNAVLVDGGLPRVDMAQAYAEHKNPCPSLAGKTFPKPSGRSMRASGVTSCFIRKPFADLVPADFQDYIDERCQDVQPSTVCRDLDVFSAICHLAIDTWRIPIAKSPMDGILKPKFFNERDRRLRPGEEERLLDAAFAEDQKRGIAKRLDELVEADRPIAASARSTYGRKKVIKAARQRFEDEATATYVHVPAIEAFVHFQLMTGARRGEALALTWDNVDFERQTAFIPESKNGRPRTLALRTDVLEVLAELPHDTETVFNLSLDTLRKSWARMCKAAGFEGTNSLHVHDLRHEAISRVADAGSSIPGGMSLVDLQAFSGHRDTRMLLRYTHLCMPSFAKRLDAVFKDKKQTIRHAGRQRLRRGAAMSMAELTTSQEHTTREGVVAAVILHPTAQAVPPLQQDGSARTTARVIPLRRQTA